MSIQRQYERYLLMKQGITVRRKFAGRIIKRGMWRNRRGELKPRELHATKGWRHVPAWS